MQIVDTPADIHTAHSQPFQRLTEVLQEIGPLEVFSLPLVSSKSWRRSRQLSRSRETQR
jgi:hypothetical protein